MLCRRFPYASDTWAESNSGMAINTEKQKELRENPAPVPIRLPQIPHEAPRD
jgi:hypothetical protein